MSYQHTATSLCWMRANNRPSALNTPEAGGMMISEIPAWAAKVAPCTAPLPPNATMEKSPGLRPISLDTAWMARVIAASATA